jgi:hypothetical protein
MNSIGFPKSVKGNEPQTLVPGAHLPWRAVPGSAGVKKMKEINQESFLSLSSVVEIMGENLCSGMVSQRL